MLKVICEIWSKRTDYNHKIGFPASSQNTFYDLTDYLIEDGVKLTKRIEYDSFESIAFAECEITFINNPKIKTIKRLIVNRDFLGIIKISFANKNYFTGIIDVSNVSEDIYADTITFKVEDILKNLLDFWDLIPIPLHRQNLWEYIPVTMNETTTYKTNVFELGIKDYYLPHYCINNVNFIDNKVKVMNFRNGEFNLSGIGSYYTLAHLSNRWAKVDNIHIDKFSMLDLLLECAKFQTWCIFLEDKQLNLRSKVFPYGDALEIDDYLIEGIRKEYDYKPKYDGIVMNFYNSTGIYEGWYIFYRNTPIINTKFVRVQRVKDIKQINQTFLDMRYNFYSNIKESAERYTRGYTENAVVFNTDVIVVSQSSGSDIYYWRLDYPFPNYYYYYFNNLLLGRTALVKAEAIGLDYQVGKDYKIDGKNYILVEAEYNFEEEKTNLTLRNLE